MSIDETTIEEIKRQNDIVEVISSYVSLIKKGKNYVSICPFHNDTNPSMVISQDKQIYKCFSCDAGGNVITFVKEFEKISFVEALQKLATRAGIQLDLVPNIQGENSHESFQEYYKLNEEAANLYQYLLMENPNSIAADYLDGRGITEAIQQKFKIGYCSMNNVVTNLFKQKEYDLNRAVELGLLTIKDDEYQDNYQNRIIYPIIDIHDCVLGFTCRGLGDASPKYLNSIESKIFNKSQLLFNINNAKESIKKEKVVYILEGPNDVIAFDKAKLENAVCVMGTALTTEHVKLLKKVGATQVVLGFDGDEAGQKATYNAIKVLEKAQVSMKYLNFDKYDPDEYLNEYGYQKFMELVKQPSSALEFRINYEFYQVNVNNYLDKKNIVIKIVTDLNNVLDEFDKEYYYNYLAKLSGISYELITSFAQRKQLVSTKAPVVSSIKANERSDIDNASLNILYYVMNDKKYFDVFNQEIGTFINQRYRKLYNIVAAHYLENELFNIAHISEETVEKESLSLLMKILLTYDYDNYNDEEIFLDSISTLKLEAQSLELEKLQNELKESVEPLHKAQISTEILKLTEYINNAKRIKFNK